MESLTVMATSGLDNSTASTSIKAPDPGQFEVREAGHDDRDAVRTLFSAIFPDEMSASLWEWKYARPQSRAIVVLKDGNVVAHFGGIGLDMLLEGQPQTVVQITDLMVDPKVRHAVRRKSPFYLCAKTFLDSFAGFDKPYFLVYGFPSARAMVLLEKLDLAKTIDHMLEVQWPLENVIPRAVSNRLIELDASNFDYHADAVNVLWETFSRRFDQHFLCRKNASYFRWRYLQHPVKKYTIYLQKPDWLRRGARLFVLRHDGHRSMLMDVLDPAMDIDAVVTTAKKLSVMENKKTLVTWCTGAFKSVFDTQSAKFDRLPLAIPANTCSPAMSWEQQVDKWWLMPGDTDYQ